LARRSTSPRTVQWSPIAPLASNEGPSPVDPQERGTGSSPERVRSPHSRAWSLRGHGCAVNPPQTSCKFRRQAGDALSVTTSEPI